MNILVCIKFIVDPNQLQADEATGKPDFQRASYRINNWDEQAIEAALQLTTQHGGKVVAISLIKTLPPKELILTALAMGLDSVYLVKDEAGLAADAFRIASVLAAAAGTVAERESVDGWDVVLCGEASVDDYNGQVGPRLGTALDLPIITYATRLDLSGNRLTADRAVEERSETVETDLPALITVGMEINDPRRPTVLQIMGAGGKPTVELDISDLNSFDGSVFSAEASIRDIEIAAPPSTRKQQVVEGDSPDEIVEELLNQLGAAGEVAF